jgi:hypothetical protein
MLTLCFAHSPRPNLAHNRAGTPFQTGVRHRRAGYLERLGLMRQLLHIAAFWVVVIVTIRVAVCFPHSLLARVFFATYGPVGPVNSRPEIVCQVFFAVVAIEVNSGEPRRLSAFK